MRTGDKILLGVLFVALVVSSGVMIAAIQGNEDSFVQKNGVIVISNKDSGEDFEEDGDFDEDESEDVAITGTPLERASAAALAYLGEGKVTDSEIGDEEGYYEIEITLDNGGEADVHLDENFRVLSVEYD